MADGKPTASKPKSLLPMAWAVFVAVLAGLLLWLSGTADDTVSDLYARADEASLRTVADLPERPDAPEQMAESAAESPEEPDEEPAEEQAGEAPPPVPEADEPAEEPADDGGDADPEPETVEEAVEEPAEELAQDAIETTDTALPLVDPAETVEIVEPADTAGETTEQTATAGLQAEDAANGDVTGEEPVDAGAADDETELALVEPPAPDISPDLDEELPPWQANSRPFDATVNSPRIAIVITDLGLSAAATQLAIQDLPGEVTLAFAAHAPNLDTWIPQTRAAGHEALVMVPMEPEDYPVNDPGPYTLLTSQAPSTNIDRLDWSLRRATGFVGIIDTKGSRFTAVADAVQPVVQEIANRGLLVLDSGSEASVMPAVARENQVPVTASDTFITDFASGNAIDLRLAELEAIAEDNGSAVGVAFPYPILFERLRTWIDGLDEKGIVLAPITAVVDAPN